MKPFSPPGSNLRFHCILVAFSHPVSPSFLFLEIPQSCLVSHDSDYFEAYWSVLYTISLDLDLSDVSL